MPLCDEYCDLLAARVVAALEGLYSEIVVDSR